MYPGGFTKAGVLDYYVQIAPALLPHFKERPVALKRFPDGVRGRSYWEKDAPSFTPAWVKRAPVWRVSGESQIHYIVVANVKTLAWLAGIGVLELHPFLHRAANVQQPTSVVFDLDPGPPADILTCATVAFLLRERLQALGLTSCVKVSGSKGLQLYVPLNVATTYDVTQPFARLLAEELAASHPKLVVAEMTRSLRAGKVFIDWSQNATHKTTVGVYSLRAKGDRPFVSLPITWEELERASKKRDGDALFWDAPAALTRVQKVGDLFEPVLTLKQELPAELVGLKAGATAAPPVGSRDIAPRTVASGFSRTWTRSRQGSRRRFIVTRRNGRMRLWLEGDATSNAIERRKAGAVDFGTYEVVEGSVKSGAVDIAFAGKKLRGGWRLSRQHGRWRLAPKSAERRIALPKFVPPMLAEQRAAVPRGDQWAYELKLDGYRVEAAKAGDLVTLYSRRGNDLTADYPDVVRAVAGLAADSALIDGEVVAVDEQGRPSFQALHHSAGKAFPIVYYAFDMLARDGRDLRQEPLDTRKAELADLVSGSDVRLSETLHGDPDRIVAAIKALKLEGLIAKRRASPYSSRRASDWVKVKFLKRQEFVIGAYKPGFDNFESLVVGYHDEGRLWFAGKVRSGFTASLRATLWKQIRPLESKKNPFADAPSTGRSHWGEGLTTQDLQKLRWLKPVLVAEIGFVEWTRDGHLRHSTFVSLRSDKDPRDVVREEPAG
jgi:bifunctional non-homologous end joining protein LigD